MMRTWITAFAITSVLCGMGTSCSAAETGTAREGTQIVLSDNGITADGAAASQTEGDAVYLANDIVYYEEKTAYDSGNPYGEGTEADMHTAQEAASHTVVHITQPGTYILSGTLSAGQIAVDLGEDAKTDPEAVVTLVLNGVDITCTVAPAVIFYNVYECDTAWVDYDEGTLESYTASAQQDTSAAGANVILADGSVNTVNGSYVARIYKDNAESKKLHKYDGAFYSKMSMNITGEEAGTGILEIEAENEGLDTELHLTINGGIIRIHSQNDGINTNEDGVSVTTINGGSLHIVAGLGAEGDGIDSNGYLVINGGTVIAAANPASDSGLDADLGSYINGGSVIATGSTMDWAESDSNQVTLNLQFASRQTADEAILITKEDGTVLFAYDPDADETTGSDNRSYQGAVISSPNFAVGETYYVYVGGSVDGEDVDGLYDPATVTGFTGAVQQVYTGTDVGRGGMGGRGGNMEREEITFPMTEEQAQSLLARAQQSDTTVTAEDLMACTSMEEVMALLGEPDRSKERPQGEPGQQPPEKPEGEPPTDDMTAKPEGDLSAGNPPDRSGDASNTVLSENDSYSNTFYMNDKVNAFSGVQDTPASEN